MIPNHFNAVLSILDAPKPVIAGAGDNSNKLRDILHSYKVSADVIGAVVGPTVTRYHVRPRDGVRSSEVTRLRADIQRLMQAKSLRIEEPVAGTDYMGLEIPNAQRQHVGFKSLVADAEFQNASSKLVFTLGKSVDGKMVFADLAKMPHLLVSGATNSGKSVFLNSLIMSLAMRSTPEELQFTLIDPKQVELTAYNGLPHLRQDAITTPRDAVKALISATQEMTKRYTLLNELGVRNIVSYNAKTTGTKMPYHVIIVDELADLMMSAKKEVETAITRLSQLARAVGIHLVLATQRPSVNVITGTIKANLPARIAFALPTAIDSRTILDESGAESLLGNGDMLFSSPQEMDLQRIQGGYLSEDEVSKAVAIIGASCPKQTAPAAAPALPTPRPSTTPVIKPTPKPQKAETLGEFFAMGWKKFLKDVDNCNNTRYN